MLLSLDRRRWYDNTPSIKAQYDTLTGMPEKLQTLMADALLWIMICQGKVSTKGKPFVSIGTEKVVGLHQSKKKRRSYDQNQSLHDALNSFYLLTPEDQSIVSDSMWELLALIQHYYASCFLAKEAVDFERLSTIAKTCATKGTAKAQEVVTDIIQKTHEASEPAVNRVNATKNTPEEIAERAIEEQDIPPVEPPRPRPQPGGKASSFGSRYRR